MISTPTVKFDLAARLLEGARGTRVAVVGDIMLDRYLAGDVKRISPEAPVPVVTVRRQRRALGGAGNVAAGLRVLGISCRLVGVVGPAESGPPTSVS